MKWRKAWKTMYSRSLVGAGFGVFAIMDYVIKMQEWNSEDRRFTVDLNPRVLTSVFGESEEKITAAIEYLCRPDPASQIKDHEGRRLVQLEGPVYHVVSGVHYQMAKRAEEVLDGAALRQRAFRRRKKAARGGTMEERTAVERGEVASASEMRAPEQEPSALGLVEKQETPC
jgi:hypothetical protein